MSSKKYLTGPDSYWEFRETGPRGLRASWKSWAGLRNVKQVKNTYVLYSNISSMCIFSDSVYTNKAISLENVYFVIVFSPLTRHMKICHLKRQSCWYGQMTEIGNFFFFWNALFCERPRVWNGFSKVGRGCRDDLLVYGLPRICGLKILSIGLLLRCLSWRQRSRNKRQKKTLSIFLLGSCLL